MDVWVVEFNYMSEHHKVIGVALTRDLARLIAEQDFTERHPDQINHWVWQDIDEEPEYPRSYCDGYTIDRYQIKTS